MGAITCGRAVTHNKCCHSVLPDFAILPYPEVLYAWGKRRLFSAKSAGCWHESIPYIRRWAGFEPIPRTAMQCTMCHHSWWDSDLFQTTTNNNSSGRSRRARGSDRAHGRGAHTTPPPACVCALRACYGVGAVYAWAIAGTINIYKHVSSYVDFFLCYLMWLNVVRG